MGSMRCGNGSRSPGDGSAFHAHSHSSRSRPADAGNPAVSALRSMSKKDQVYLALIAAAAAGVFSAGLRFGIHQYSDFTQIWAASRAYLHGANPYRAVGPGTPFDWDFVLPYPFPAVLVGAPIALVPWRVADVLFVMLSAGLLAFAVQRRGPLPSAFFPLIAPPTIYALALSQWSPLLTGAALLPAAGWLLACKPTIGAAYAAAWPSKSMLIGVVVFTAISVLLRPSWIGEWWTNIRTLTHPVAPIVLPGGFLVAAALWRWRRAEARLLVALACVPQTAL